ncbi:hypothetical protein OSTOST_05721 [Ostertagia ostertagi]
MEDSVGCRSRGNGITITGCHATIHSSLSSSLVLLLLAAELHADDDCYKYSKQEFTTIIECDHGCEYVYKTKDSKNRRISGGCAAMEDSVGCRSRGNGITVCVCHGDYCNAKGYEMAGDSHSDER